MIQIIMITCGYLLWLCASSANEFGNQTMAGITINTSSWSQVLLADCVSGLCIVLLLLGVFGFVLLCKHECSLKETLAELEETTELGHASMLSGSSGGTRDLGAPIGQNRQSLDRGLDHGAGRRYRDLHGPPPTPMDCTGCYSRSDGCCNIVLWIAAVCQRTVTTSTVILAIIVAVTYADLAAVMAVVGQVTVGGEVVVQWRISC